MRIKTIVLSLFFMSSGGFAAFAQCSPPSAPSCTGAEETYKDKDAYSTCQAEVEAHHKASLAYITCMKTELEETAKKVQADIDKVSDKSNALIKEFNCKSGNAEEC
jgi:hypothetical protein